MMIEREKVIKGFECCLSLSDNFPDECLKCPYVSDMDSEVTCMRKMGSDAITLLKEQGAVEPIYSYGTFRCGKCKNIVGYNDGCGHGYQNNFCSNCGKAVKWNG